jgi:hypothetical protein
LGRDDANPNLYTLEKHTLPYFVPLRELAQQLLNVDFNRFLDITSDFVNALVSRRQQCETIKRFAAVESLNATDAFDYVQLSILAWSDVSIVVFAVFDNPRSHKPTRIEVTQTAANGAPEALDDITAKLLLYNRLDEALIAVLQLRE